MRYDDSRNKDSKKILQNLLQYLKGSMSVLNCNICKPPDCPIIATSSNIFCCCSHALVQFQLIHLNERFIHRSHLSRDKESKEHGHLKVIPNKSLLPLVPTSIIICSDCSTAPVIKQLKILIRKHLSARYPAVAIPCPQSYIIEILPTAIP